ncbi:MAG: hypothetical protein ABSG91_25825 [Syntrophobacteraceae bacterium]|jgi:hypothetical protein
MIPVGYMAKNVVSKPEWLKTDRVFDLYSISNCMSDNFADYIQYWKHNGYWFFDSPYIILSLSAENNINLNNTKLFFYEVYELEYDEKKQEWRIFKPETTFLTDVKQPENKKLEGFDIATFFTGNEPQCSPLSCNALAETIITNEHCLIKSLDEAKKLLETFPFNKSEPGPFRIFAVYSVEWPVNDL